MIAYAGAGRAASAGGAVHAARHACGLRPLRHEPPCRRRGHLGGSGAARLDGGRRSTRRARACTRSTLQRWCSSVAGCSCSPGSLRLGFIAQFLSRPVIEGFVFGLAIFVTVKQLPKLFGIAVREGKYDPAARACDRAPRRHPRRDACGRRTERSCSCSGGERWFPKVPGGLVVLVLGIAVSAGLRSLESRRRRSSARYRKDFRPSPIPPPARWRHHGADRRSGRDACSSSSASRPGPRRTSRPSTATRSTRTRS